MAGRMRLRMRPERIGQAGQNGLTMRESLLTMTKPNRKVVFAPRRLSIRNTDVTLIWDT